MFCRQALTCNRSLVLDIVALCSRHALFPLEKTFDLAELALLRARLPERVSWAVLFMKAYAIVAARTPQLRQVFVRWPYAHLRPYAEIVGMLAVNRQWGAEERLCWARFIHPERHGVSALQDALDAYQRLPVQQVFRRQVQFSRLPALLRRLVWRANLDWPCHKRPRRIGTFAISTLAGQGVINRYFPTLTTSSLSYGRPDRSGSTPVTLICDHRVIDGALGARVLAQLEQSLCEIIADELREPRRAAA